jgi:hypothetical protein
LAIFTLKSVLRNPEAAGARQRLGHMASPLLQHEGTKDTKDTKLYSEIAQVIFGQQHTT